MSKYTITDNSHLATLEGLLADNLYIGGHAPNAEDVLVFEQFVLAKTEPNQESHINLWSWYSLISLYEDNVKQQWKVASTQQAPKKDEKKPVKKDEPKKEQPKAETKDECDDLFGDDGDDAEALEAMKKKAEDKKKADADKKKKDAPVQKSIIILDIKVWETEQNLDDLAAKVLTIQKDGLFWKTEYKLADVAFGVKKLVMGLVVEDEKVSVDDIIEELEGWEDDVQSVDIVSFNKI